MQRPRFSAADRQEVTDVITRLRAVIMTLNEELRRPLSPVHLELRPQLPAHLSVAEVVHDFERELATVSARANDVRAQLAQHQRQSAEWQARRTSAEGSGRQDLADQAQVRWAHHANDASELAAELSEYEFVTREYGAILGKLRHESAQTGSLSADA